MKHYVTTILGMLLILSAIWGGAYFMSSITPKDWQHAPTYFTSCIVFLIGVMVTVVGIVKITTTQDKKERQQ